MGVGHSSSHKLAVILMKRTTLISGILITLLFSCTNEKKVKNIDSLQNQNSTTEIVINEGKTEESGKVLLQDSIKHPFSEPNKDDTFKIKLSGKSILEGKVNFQIFNSENKLIHSENFDSADLLGDLDIESSTAEQRQDTIIKRMKYFFSNENFLEPAVSKHEDLESDIEKEIFDDIKSDKTAIGFMYSIGYEGLYIIAYSKKMKKVVLYFYSD